MSTQAPATGRLSIEAYAALGEDPPGERWELSEGELIVSPGPVFRHNRIRDRLASRLDHLVDAQVGEIVTETDTRLGVATIRRPDIAFFRSERLVGIDTEVGPMPYPDLAIEVVSTHDRADDLLLKVRQYLAAGASAVWLLYPKLGLAHRYSPASPSPEARASEADEAWEEPELLPSIRLPLRGIFAAAKR